MSSRRGGGHSRAGPEAAGAPLADAPGAADPPRAVRAAPGGYSGDGRGGGGGGVRYRSFREDAVLGVGLAATAPAGLDGLSGGTVLRHHHSTPAHAHRGGGGEGAPAPAGADGGAALLFPTRPVRDASAGGAAPPRGAVAASHGQARGQQSAVAVAPQGGWRTHARAVRRGRRRAQPAWLTRRRRRRRRRPPAAAAPVALPVGAVRLARRGPQRAGAGSGGGARPRGGERGARGGRGHVHGEPVRARTRGHPRTHTHARGRPRGRSGGGAACARARAVRAGVPGAVRV